MRTISPEFQRLLNSFNEGSSTVDEAIAGIASLDSAEQIALHDFLEGLISQNLSDGELIDLWRSKNSDWPMQTPDDIRSVLTKARDFVDVPALKAINTVLMHDIKQRGDANMRFYNVLVSAVEMDLRAQADVGALADYVSHIYSVLKLLPDPDGARETAAKLVKEYRALRGRS